MLLTEFDEKKFAKSIWKEGHESGYTEGRESILEILDAINRGNDTVEKLTAFGLRCKNGTRKYWRRNKSKQQWLCSK